MFRDLNSTFIRNFFNAIIKLLSYTIIKILYNSKTLLLSTSISVIAYHSINAFFTRILISLISKNSNNYYLLDI